MSKLIRIFVLLSIVYFILIAALTADANEYAWWDEQKYISYECWEAKYFNEDPLAFLDIEGCE